MNNQHAVKYWSWMGAFAISALFWLEVVRTFVN
ncbi:small membrane protein YmiC [Cedecea lapagei]|nr:small membrane protein YmiC [Cedecea lapagei]